MAIAIATMSLLDHGESLEDAVGGSHANQHHGKPAHATVLSFIEPSADRGLGEVSLPIEP